MKEPEALLEDVILIRPVPRPILVSIDSENSNDARDEPREAELRPVRLREGEAVEELEPSELERVTVWILIHKGNYLVDTSLPSSVFNREITTT